jgi:RNA polymerase sigma-70 factor, ECF subfamily
MRAQDCAAEGYAMGDDGFDEFYRASSRRVLRFAYAMTGDGETAQDLTQEAFIRAWRSWSRVSRYEHPESWVRVVVARLATDVWRRTRVRRRHEAALRPPEPIAGPSELTVVLIGELRRLPPRQRHAFCLYYLLDLPVAQIAAEVGVSPGTVKSWLHRARAVLAHRLDANNPSEQGV